MSGYYPPPGHSIPPQYYNIDHNSIPNNNNGNNNNNNNNVQHAPQTMIGHGSYPMAMPDNPFQPGAPGPFVQYENIGQPSYPDQYDDASGPIGSVHAANSRARRRPAPGEQVKHRRTRSGCFTCRQRRVKVCGLFSLSLSTCAKWPARLTCSSVTKTIPSARVSACFCL